MKRKLIAATTVPVADCTAPIKGVSNATPITEVDITPEATPAWGPRSSNERLYIVGHMIEWKRPVPRYNHKAKVLKLPPTKREIANIIGPPTEQNART